MATWKARAMAAVLGAAVMMPGIAGAALADPTNAKKGEILTIECDHGLGSLTVALNGNTDLNIGHVTTSTQVVVPYRLHVEVTITPTGGDPQTFVNDIVKPAPRNGRLAVCTFHQEDQNDAGTFVLDGTVWVSATPAR